MKKMALIFTVFTFLYVNSFSQTMSGTYFIGGASPDYNTFNEAVTDLSDFGISDAVVFIIEPGTYNEQLIIPEIEGASEINTISFQSATEDSTDVILTYASESTDSSYVIMLDTCKYVQFKYLTIKSESVIYDNNLIEINNGEGIHFINCQLLGSVYETTNYSYTKNILISNENLINADNLKIKNCYFNSGDYGIILTGKSHEEQSSALEISGNTFLNQKSSAIRVLNYKNSEISNNNIFSSPYYQGIRLSYCSNIDVLNNYIDATTLTGISLWNNDLCNVRKNIIYNFTSAGIQIVQSDGTSEDKVQIINNFISGEGRGIYVYYSAHLNIFHNSINTSDICLTIESDNNSIINNILYNRNGGNCLSIDQYATNLSLNYNDIYTLGPVLANWKGTICAGLDELRTASGQDANSVSYNPDFFSDTDLHTLSIHLNNMGTPLSEVLTDINGNPRDPGNPDIGAVEFDPLTIDMKIIDFILPDYCSLGTEEDITIKLVNSGTDAQNNIPVQYSIDNGQNYINETIFTTINPGDSLTYTFTTKADFSGLGKYECIGVVNVAGDEKNENDSAKHSVISYPDINLFPFIEDFESGNNFSFFEESGEQADIMVNSEAACNSNYGLYFVGGEHNTGWIGGSSPDSTNIWVNNTKFHASAYSCDIDISSLSNPVLQFDIRVRVQYYTSWFRVLVNDAIQIRDRKGNHTYKTNMTDFETKQFELSDFSGENFSVRFQSCCNIATENMVYLDNIIIGELPIVDIGNDTLICDNKTITLDAGETAGYSYYWREISSPDIIGTEHQIIISEAGTYYVIVYSDIGILNSDTITIGINPTYYFTEQESICDDDSFLWHGSYYSNPGIYYEYYTATTGCDSIYELQLTVNPTYYFVEEHTICSNDELFWHENYYSEAGTYYAEYKTTTDCDSIYELQLTVNQAYLFAEKDTVCEGESLLWRGDYYDTAGTYYDNYTSVNECDSIYELQLFVNQVYFFTEHEAICEGEEFLWHGNYYSETGTYYEDYITINDCDSIYELQLTVNPNYYFIEEHTICSNEELLWHGDYYSEAGTYYAEYKTITDCDSIYELQLFVNQAYSFTEQDTICEGDEFLWHGNYYSETGTYYENYITTTGCDSIYELQLFVNPAYFFTEHETICDGEEFFWYGNYYSETGTYYENYSTINECDSIYELHLTVNLNYHFTEQEIICSNDELFWHGDYYSESGIYYADYTATTGCDSIYELQLAVNDAYYFTEQDTICEGDEFLWHGNYYSESGTYYENYTTTTECDSIYELQLVVNPKPYPFIIIGQDFVMENGVGTYFVPENPDLVYIWDVQNGNIIDQISNSTAEIQWGTIGTGYIYVLSENEFECVSDTAILVVTIGPSNINTLFDNNYISIYPNPVKNIINVDCRKEFQMEIYSVLGEKILETNQTATDISDLKSGTYIVLIRNDEDKLIKIDKIVKE